jgi:tetratricopeptide (TPR) repeat protein
VLRRTGDRYGEANVHDSLGYLHDCLGDHPEAVASYRRALGLFERLGDSFYLADTLTHLGAAQRHAGEGEAARRTWSRALELLDDLGHAAAGTVRASLAELDGVADIGVR